jgi:DNA polymerase-3 subunit epsilon
LLRDLSDGVIACSLDRRILLFNDAALRILASPVELGLNRPLDALIAREPIADVLDVLRQRHAAGPDGDPALRQEFVCGTADGGLLLRCRMAPIMGPDRAVSGFILDFSDAAPRASGTWPMADVLSSDLVRAVGHRLAEDRLRLVAVGAGAWLQVDAWSVTLLLERLARRIAAQGGVGAIDLEAHAEGARVTLDLVWPGEPLAAAIPEPWLDEPLATGAGESLRDVLRRHGSTPETGPGGRAGFSRLRLPLAPPARPRIEALAPPVLPPRPEFYDFEILARPEGQDGPLLERPLAGLDYVVFDTETTGLDPRHDRIVQLAGVRIVNRRLLSGEVFDALVNPGQPIAEASIRFHGITDAMVAGRPPIEVVLPQFHRFAQGAVLVAHNAAFDMAFLQRDAGDAGVAFDQPVLDSLLLSAVLHDHEQRHTLDAIAARFGITLSDRHQALGDALGTAQVFLRMLDLLAAADIRTLGGALAASEQARALRREQRRQFGSPAATKPR